MFRSTSPIDSRISKLEEHLSRENPILLDIVLLVTKVRDAITPLKSKQHPIQPIFFMECSLDSAQHREPIVPLRELLGRISDRPHGFLNIGEAAARFQ